MKFAAVFTIAAASVAFVAAAPQVATNGVEPDAAGTCTSGQAQCCSSVKSGDEARDASELLGLGSVLGSIGLNCEQIPINIIGAAFNIDNQCKNTPVCCTGAQFNGLVQVGCTPFPIN